MDLTVTAKPKGVSEPKINEGKHHRSIQEEAKKARAVRRYVRKIEPKAGVAAKFVTHSDRRHSKQWLVKRNTHHTPKCISAFNHKNANAINWRTDNTQTHHFTFTHTQKTRKQENSSHQRTGDQMPEMSSCMSESGATQLSCDDCRGLKWVNANQLVSEPAW
jgi:hypothetical protein